MTTKQKITLYSLLALFFIVIYVLVAVKPLGKELKLIPQWKITITDKSLAVENASKKIPFQLGQILGYFTPEGEIALLTSYPFQGTISSSYWATYPADSKKTSVYTPDLVGLQQSPLFTIDRPGFPFFSEDRIYIFTPGGYGVAHYNPQGEEVWSFEGYAPITTFASSSSGTAIGYANGSLVTYTTEGELKQVFEPGGSQYPIILGTAISESGNFLACVSGIDQQRFVLTKETNGLNKVVFHTYLQGNLRIPVLVKFSSDEKLVYYSCYQGLGVVNTENYSHTMLPVKGQIVAIEESETTNITLVLTKNKDDYTVYLIENGDSIIGSFSYQAKSSFIVVDEDDLYIGKDVEILKLHVAQN